VLTNGGAQDFQLAPVSVNGGDFLYFIVDANGHQDCDVTQLDLRIQSLPPVSGESTITIIKDAQPNSRRNFRFADDLGPFRLDNVLPDDADAYTQSQTFAVEPGVYRVREEAPGNWLLSDITCTPAGSGAVNLADHQVTITLTGDHPVSCTFTNQRRSLLRVQTYHDGNGDAQRNRDVPSLSRWTIQLYDAAQSLVGAQVTNAQGKVSFTGLRPGNYTVCEALAAGWVNTQPGLVDATFNQPCYVLTLGPGQFGQAFFGNSDRPVAGAAHPNASEGVVIFEAPDREADDENYEVVDTDEVWLNTPDEGAGLYLPLIPAE
jgi:hypothetical protein